MNVSDEVIVQTVRQLQRIYGRGVLPWEVTSWLPFEISIGYTRKSMAALWKSGKLRRVGGAGARRGYTVRVSRLEILRVDGRLAMVA